MQKYDHIKEKKSNEMRFLHDTFQIEIKFVVLVKIIEKSWQVWYHSKDNLKNQFFKQFAKKPCVKCTCLHTTLYKNGKMCILIEKHV